MHNKKLVLLLVGFSSLYAPEEPLEPVDIGTNDPSVDDLQRGRVVQDSSNQHVLPKQQVPGQLTNGAHSSADDKPSSLVTTLPILEKKRTPDTAGDLGDAYVIADRPLVTASYRTVSNQELQTQLHAILKMINTFTESISKNDLKPTYIFYAARVLELMGDFEDEVSQQGINDIDT